MAQNLKGTSLHYIYFILVDNKLHTETELEVGLFKGDFFLTKTKLKTIIKNVDLHLFQIKV